jgi:hypothetical protein
MEIRASPSVATHGSSVANPSDPDRNRREIRAATEFLQFGNQGRPGTLERSRLILDIIGRTYPTAALTAGYFENLDRLLSTREKLASPGRLVLGIGSGRCGSTTLTELMTTVEGSVSTHENPPVIFWDQQDEQVAFHLRRFELLRQYFPLVFDAAHWWINVVDNLFAIFPDAKIIGLYRDIEQCVRSFMRMKGRGLDSENHWVPSDNGIWRTGDWDRAYPTYPVPDNARVNPDRAKAEVIRRYVSDYNRTLASLADRFPERVMLMPTERLERTSEQRRMFRFIGLSGRLTRAHLNAGTVIDGHNIDYRF